MLLIQIETVLGVKVGAISCYAETTDVTGDIKFSLSIRICQMELISPMIS